MTRRFEYRKGRLTRNPIGLYVAMPWKDRTLLGEVIRCEYNATRGTFIFSVRHFNGDSWPVQPVPSALEIIE